MTVVYPPPTNKQLNSTGLQSVYFLLSIFSIAAGFLIYYFLREKNLLVFEWFHFSPRGAGYIPFSPGSPWADFLRYNLPDGLWLLSGLLFLRALWYGEKAFLCYKIVFLFFAFLLETLQIIDGIPGTFDVRDLIVYAIATFVEGVFYYCFVKRRIYYAN